MTKTKTKTKKIKNAMQNAAWSWVHMTNQANVLNQLSHRRINRYQYKLYL
jgi:hypothetical protein